jgi:putative hemolysin
MEYNPFHLDFNTPGLGGQFGRLASRIAEHALAFPTLNRIHQQTLSLGPARSFFERALEALDVNVRVPQEDLSRIPKTGPLIVVANHPFGGLDGIILTALLQRIRPDVKVLANHLLEMIPQIRDTMLFVDPFGGHAATTRNLSSIRAALRHMKDGGALAVFPAGEVSSFNRNTREIADIGWSSSVARLIRGSGARVLPVFFSGHNSAMFHVAGLIHPRLRTLLLPRELLRQRGQSITVHIGHPIAPAKLNEIDTDEQLASYLRARTYLLGGRSKSKAAVNPHKPAKIYEPIAHEEDSTQIAAEIAKIPSQNILASTGPLQVLYASAMQLDAALREIGRLREITFRKVGEGTGKARDLDEFDRHYLHLLVWNNQKNQVVGSYRMGLTDQILSTLGPIGLYTNTLFNFKPELLNQIDPAIELGRSFVRPEYQKEFAPLMLLWKGIAHFCARHPRYRRLFGTVSISNDYQSLSRQILMAFLNQNASSPDLARGVIPKNPPRFLRGRDHTSKLAALAVKSVEAVDELLGEIESDRGGMPVLLRQYLRLNAKLLGFNVDPDFGDVLDGLMLVDLLQVERAILTRYMGRENLADFYTFHGKQVSK